MAQTTEFPLPENLPAGSTVRIQSSPNLGLSAKALEQEFEATYDGSDVSVDVTSSDQAVAALLAGNVDLAAIGRPLTAGEVDQGLVSVPVARDKIAIIIGPENSFTGNLTFKQFAQIFRGEIKDWSELGGEPGPIRLVDRPEGSDTRRSLSQYEVFLAAPFQTGSTATQLAADDTAATIQALGKDGISYAIASHVINQDGVKIVPMHNTLPDDPRYPYSQPQALVYRGEPSPAAAAFLGYATASAGQAVLATVRETEADEIASALSGAATGTAAAGSESAESTSPAVGAAPETAGQSSPEATIEGDPGSPPAEPTSPTAEAVPATTDADGRAGWLWWLLPLAALLGLGAWALTRRKHDDQEAAAGQPASFSPQEAAPASAIDSSTVPAVAPSAAVEPPAVVPSPVVGAVPAEPSPAAAGLADASLPEATPIEAEPPIAAAKIDHPIPTPISPPSTPIDGPAIGASLPNAAAMTAAAGAAGLAASAAAAMASTEDQSVIEASKYNVVGRPADREIDLAGIDDGLPPLPDGYGESRIVLMPRDPQWAYAYWDVANSHKEEQRRHGGQQLALRLYDVTDIDLSTQTPHNLQQVNCDELAREWYLPIPISDRDYLVEIGYLTADGRWLLLARSNRVRIPPVYPSEWNQDQFISVEWEDNLRGKTLLDLGRPDGNTDGDYSIYEHMFALAQSTENLRMAGSLYGSMQHVAGSIMPQPAFPQETISSYIFPSGVGSWAVPTMSGLTMSGIGFFASAPPIRPRKFWLVADAELIVYGATEPDATVTISGQPIQLMEDGTFRFQSSFQDGNIDYPIMAVASDGEQTRSIHMTFQRQTLERHTNTRDDAQEEWPPYTEGQP